MIKTLSFIFSTLYFIQVLSQTHEDNSAIYNACMGYYYENTKEFMEKPIVVSNVTVGYFYSLPRDFIRKELCVNYSTIEGIDTMYVVQNLIWEHTLISDTINEYALYNEYFVIENKDSIECHFQPCMTDTYTNYYDCWDLFYQAYNCDGVIKMSRPFYYYGFALVYFQQSSGPLAGSGQMYLLTKQNAKWIVIDEYFIWLS